MFGLPAMRQRNLLPLPYFSPSVMPATGRSPQKKIIKAFRPEESQVTVNMRGINPCCPHVLIAAHRPDVSLDKLKKEIIDHVIKKKSSRIKVFGFKNQSICQYYRRFCIGGPHGDTGLRAVKLLFDTYGRLCPSRPADVFPAKIQQKLTVSGSYGCPLGCKKTFLWLQD